MSKVVYRCEVEGAGAADDSKIYIKLKGVFKWPPFPKPGPGFETNWFCAPEAQRKEMLAIALAAITSQIMVDAEFEEPFDPKIQAQIARLDLQHKALN